MNAAVIAPERTVPQAAWHAEWLVAFGPDLRDRTDAAPTRRWTSGAVALVVRGIAGSDLRIAEDDRYVVLFTGYVTNATELDPSAGQSDAASLALRRVYAGGCAALAAFRGPFAVMVWDRERSSLTLVRDHVGLEPLFYAQSGSTWLLSPSPTVLTSEPGVSRQADATAISEWLCGWFPAIEDTTYRDVKRVPPGSMLTLPDGTLRRYWDPFDESTPMEWLREEDLVQFEPLLRNAVQRATQGSSPAIFLSGGVDSISVAVMASEVMRGAEAPLALSLVFPDEASSEEKIQSGVARQLGMSQVLLPFNEAVGPQGLLAAALDLSATWPQPMWNIWSPAYSSLARFAGARERRVILTGRGGDEWLTISPYLLADQLKRGDVAGMSRLLRMRHRSNNLRSARAAARLVWTTAGRPLASAALDAIAPRWWHRKRQQRLLAQRPSWVAPDPEIRRAMDERIDRWIDDARPKRGFYHREGRTALRHPAVAHDMEETQEFGRRNGLRMLHPYWDVDLIEMLHRVPPRLLMADGRSKSLIRRKVSARLPGLGLERRGKISAGHVFQGVMKREAPEALKKLGGPRKLASLGIVRASDIQSEQFQTSLAARLGSAGRLWALINLETWVRRRA